MKIKSIKKNPQKQKVYDIQVKKNNNFFANGILVHNCIIFQESVMEIAHKIGGFSLDESDKVRKALMKRTMTGKDAAAKKQKELGEKFIIGAMKNGLAKDEADDLWADLMFFCGYGFNKSVHYGTLLQVWKTPSSTPHYKTISEVIPGEYVMSYDQKTDRDTLVRVKAVHDHGCLELVELILLSGKSVKCTWEHRFRTTDGEMLSLREIIDRGLSIMHQNMNEFSHISFVGPCGTHQTYDLEIEHPDHQFYLANGLLTSNSHAVSYAYDSVACAWLFYNYPDQWLCAWLESASGNPEEKMSAIGECKKFGYRIVPVDVNHAVKGWTSLPGKKLMPSFVSLKDVGDAAVEELLRFRPYKDFTDLLWNDDGSWRHSKANKRVWDVLTKLGAFESMDLVGDDKLFKNYRQLNYVLVDCIDRLKKKKGVEELGRILEEAQSLEDWTDIQKVEFQQEIAGNNDIETLVNKDVQMKLKNHGVREISSLTSGKDIVWFVLVDSVDKKTKNGKAYVLLTVTDTQGKNQRIFCWNGHCCSFLAKNGVFACECTKTDFGYSANMGKLKRIDQ